MITVKDIISNALSNISDQSAPVILGSLIFTGYETPGRITIGGSQQLTLHKLPGGARFIDAMGSEDGALSWRGMFIGPNAGQRARLLDHMRVDGLVRILSFGDYIFNVVVSHVEYTFKERGAIIDYRVKVEIITALLQNSTIDLTSIQEIVSDCNFAVNCINSIIPKTGMNSLFYNPVDLNILNSYIANITNLYNNAINALLLDEGDYNVGESSSYNALNIASIQTQTAVNDLSINSTNENFQEIEFDNPDILEREVYTSLAIASFTKANGYINRARINYLNKTTILS